MITPQFTPSDIERMLQEKVAKYEEKIVRILRFVGEKCINEAREYGSYQDRTGNLRSSIGYIVLKDGKPIEKGGFQLTKSGNNGQKEGETFINKIISQYTKRFVLIVVAGMKYASYVEARNYNVLTSAELLAEREVPRLLKEISK